MASLTAGADLALAACYRDWFDLCAAERRGELPDHTECRAALQAIWRAEKLCTRPRLVYEVTAGQWWADHGEEP